MTNKELFEKSAKSLIGFPIVAQLEGEVDTIDFERAFYRFFTAIPITKSKVITGIPFQVELVLDIQQLIDEYFLVSKVAIIGTADGIKTQFNYNLGKPTKISTIQIKRNGNLVGWTTGSEFDVITGVDGLLTLSGSVNDEGKLSLIYSSPPSSGNIVVEYKQDSTDWFWVGVLGLDFRSSFLPMYNPDMFLIGVAPSYNPISDFDPLKRLLAETIQDESAGEVTMEFQPHIGTKGSVRLILEGGGGLTATLGFGHKRIDWIQNNFHELFSNLVAINYLERILSVRSAVDVTTDYKLNTGLIENKLTELKDTCNKELISYGYPVIVWG